MKNRKFGLMHLSSSICFGTAGAVWLAVLMIKYYNPTTTEFAAPRSSLTSLAIFLFSGIAASAAFGVISAKKDCALPACPKYAYLIPAVFSGVSGTWSTVKILTALASSSGLPSQSSSALYKLFTVLCAIFGFLAAAHFIAKFLEKPASTPLSLALPLWAVFSIASSYFNSVFTYIDFTRLLLDVALSAAALFALAYVRSMISKNHMILMKISSAAFIISGTAYMFARLVFALSTRSYSLISDALEFSIFGVIAFAAFSPIYALSPKEKSE